MYAMVLSHKVNRPCTLGGMLVSIATQHTWIVTTSQSPMYFGWHFGVNFVYLGVLLGAKMYTKSTQGRLWDPIVPQGGPLSAQGCHLARFGGRFGVSFGPHSVPKCYQNQCQKSCDLWERILRDLGCCSAPCLAVLMLTFGVRVRAPSKNANM